MTRPFQSTSISALDGISHGFFGREGGVSRGIYASLNCGQGSEDDPRHVAENRARVASQLGAKHDQLVSIYQVHSADVAVVERPWRRQEAPKADAMVTSQPGLAIGVLTADCAPVLLADREAGVVAAAHAGWRGALGGILEQTITAMESRGAQRARLRACVGPCISFQAYEVGDEFRQRFVAADPGYEAYFGHPDGAKNVHFDLPRFAAERLKLSGVEHVEDLQTCTYGQDSRFFSYRRSVHKGESDYGRQISAILLA